MLQTGLLLLLGALSLAGSSWQQRVAYRIDVTLDTETHTLDGTERLTYSNGSPDTLDILWIHLYPNAYRDQGSVFAREPEALGSCRFARSRPEDRGFIEIRSAKVGDQELERQVEGTRMKLFLPRPLAPGDSVDITFDFLVKVPGFFSRMGHERTYYEIVQWYPKPAVYDRGGWHPVGYHALGEFYGEFGSFDVRITLPDEMTVAATGVLVEPESEVERLNAFAIEGEALEALKRESRRGLGVLLGGGGKPRPSVDGSRVKTLRFVAENVHDFAWCASPDFRLIRDRFRDTRIDVFYFPWNESYWCFAADYAKQALETYGRWYMPYPYPTLTLVNSVFGEGMEYPTLVVVGARDLPLTTYFERVIVHEVGHQWFYGILGNDEMNEAWLDEGMNTFSELRYLEAKYGRDRNLFTLPGPLPALGYRWLLQLYYYVAATSDIERPLLSPAWRMVEEPLAYLGGSYAKGAFVMDMLRGFLGERVFDELMRTYFERFRFRHPHTDDFAALASEFAGEELEWFFEPWIRGTGTCDYAVLGLSSRRQPGRGGYETRVALERLGEVRVPVEVALETADGDTATQTWDGRARRTVLRFETTEPGRRASVDPRGKVLDIDRWNNHFPRRVSFAPFFNFPSFDAYYLWLGPSGSLTEYDGLRLGVWIRGGQFPDVEMVRGRNNFTLGASYGWGSRKVWYDVSFVTPLFFGKSWLRLGFGMSKGWGQHRAYLELHGRLSRKLLGGPEHRLRAGIWMRDVYDLEPLSPRNWERAWTLGPALLYTFHVKNCGFSGVYTAGYRGSFRIRPGDSRFDRIFVDLSSRVRLPLGMSIDLRLFGGWSHGEVPAQDRFFLYGKLEPEGLARYLADGKGAFGTQEHVHVPGDGNMRGYINQYRRDRVMATANLGVELPCLPLGLFVDVGALSTELSSLEDAPLLVDFGVELDLNLLRLYVPVWVSHPRDGEGTWGFRWLLEVGPNG